MLGDNFRVFDLVVTLIFALPLAITSTVLGSIHSGICDHTDSMGLNVAHYLIGLGITNLSICVLLIFSIICIMFGLCMSVCISIVAITYVFDALFGLSWFIVGGIVLFRSNVDCINQESSHVIYALVLWCISALFIVRACLSSKAHSAPPPA